MDLETSRNQFLWVFFAIVTTPALQQAGSPTWVIMRPPGTYQVPSCRSQSSPGRGGGISLGNLLFCKNSDKESKKIIFIFWRSLTKFARTRVFRKNLIMQIPLHCIPMFSLFVNFVQLPCHPRFISALKVKQGVCYGFLSNHFTFLHPFLRRYKYFLRFALSPTKLSFESTIISLR